MSQAPPSTQARDHETSADISVGRELRRAREVRNVALCDVAEQTRISPRHLQALEDDRLQDLPGRLYARNFVRAYAQALGADEVELLDCFDYQCRQLDGRGPEADAARDESGRRRLALAGFALAVAVMVTVLALAVLHGRQDAAAAPDVAGPTAPAGDVATAAVVAGPPPSETIVPPSGEPVRSEPAGAPADADAAAEARVPAPEPPPEVATAPDRPSEATARRETESPPALPAEPEARVAPEPSPPEAPLPPSVRLAFTGPSWVEIWRQGAEGPILGIRQPGEDVTFPLDAPVQVKVFNAGAVQLSIDGRAAKPLGASGEPRTLRLSPDNWRAFLR